MGRRRLWFEWDLNKVPSVIAEELRGHVLIGRKPVEVYRRVDGRFLFKMMLEDENALKTQGFRGLWLAYAEDGALMGDITFKRKSNQAPPFVQINKLLGKPGADVPSPEEDLDAEGEEREEEEEEAEEEECEPPAIKRMDGCEYSDCPLCYGS